MALEIEPKPAIHNFNFTGDYFATFLCKYVVTVFYLVDSML